MPARRAVLLCGQQRSVVAAIARELSQSDVRLVVQSGRADLPATLRMCRAALDAAVVIGDARGEVAGEKLATAAWKAARGIDTVIVCPAIAETGRGWSDLRAWQAVGAELKAPVFLAKYVGSRLRRSGGRFLLAIDGARGENSMAQVTRAALVTVVDALGRALPPAVTVAAVIAGHRPDAAGVARGIGRFAAGDPPPNGTVLQLGPAARQG